MNEYYTYLKCNKSVSIDGVATKVAFEMQVGKVLEHTFEETSTIFGRDIEKRDCRFYINGQEYNGVLIWTWTATRKEEYIFNGKRTSSVKKAIESILNK